MLIHHGLSRSAQARPQHPALVADGRRHTYAEIDGDSDRLACHLQRLGLGRGDRVAVVMDNTAEMVVGLWAALKAGTIFVPLSHTARPERIAFILADSGARCVVAPASHRLRMAQPLAQAETVSHVVWGRPGGWGDILARSQAAPRDPGLIDQDLCAILYTSGTTGHPKGVMMTHRSLAGSVRTIAAFLRAGADDVILCVLPLASNYGLCQVLTAAETGATVVLERSFAYPYEIPRNVARHRVTVLPGVPTIFGTLLHFAPFAGLDLGSLATMTNSAAPCPPAHLLRLAELFPRTAIYSMYGMTECTRTSYLDPARLIAKPASVGRPVANLEAVVADAGGRRCRPGVAGELRVRGSAVMRGYWRRPAETAAVLVDGALPGDPWLRTGDLFRTDEDGDLHFVGRRDEMFKCRGEKVSPREIEDVLHDCPDVAEAAVVGLPHPVDGMAVTAFVVPAPGRLPTERSLRRHCQARLEAHLVPRSFVLQPSLPKTDTGKVAKAALSAPHET